MAVTPARTAANDPTTLQCVISGVFGHRVLDELRAQGLRIGPVVDLDAEAGLEPLQVADTLAVLDFDRPDSMANLWDRLAGSGCRLHLIALFADTLMVGPHFRADLPGCPDCFARRRLSTATFDDAGRLEKLDRAFLCRAPSARPGFPPYLAALAAQAFAARLRQPEEDCRGRFLRFLSDGSFLEDGMVLALHGCRCRRETAASGRRTNRHLGEMLNLGPAAPATDTLKEPLC
jgi:hypothetical protein